MIDRIKCPEGGEHDDEKVVDLFDDEGRVSGASRACSKCGITCFDLSMMYGE